MLGHIDAAQPRRDRRRSASSCRRIWSSPRSRARGIPAEHVDAGDVMITDDHFTRAEPQPELIAEARAARSFARCCASGKSPVIGGFVGATDQRHHHDARPRRIATTARRCSARRCAPKPSRSGPTWTACSPPTRASCAGARLIEQIRFDEASRARVVRREGAAPEHDRARGAPRHPGLHLQLAPTGGRGHADHVRRAAAARERDRRARRDVTVDQDAHAAHAARARLPARASSRSSTAPHVGRRRRDVRGLRLGDHRRRDAPRRAARCDLSPLGDVSVERNRGIVALVGAGLGDSTSTMARALGCARATSRSTWCR